MKAAEKSKAVWRCVKQCGACCHLDPDYRPGLEDYLTPKELEQYLSLVGPDGWCIHFNAESRECRIYGDRPRFCRVEPDVFQDLYGVSPSELNDFAIECCRTQISGLYGDRSREMSRFNRAIHQPQTEQLVSPSSPQSSP